MPNGERVYRIGAFDQKAAIELAAIEISARAAGDKRGGSSSAWQKVKIDRQIVAIAKTNDVLRIYSDDEDVRRYAAAINIEVVGIADLPLPHAKQTNLLEKKGDGPAE